MSKSSRLKEKLTLTDEEMGWLLLPVSSNIVNIIYILIFDLALPVILTLCVRVFLTSQNLKTVYHDRDTIRLRTLNFPTLVSQGLSHASLGYISTSCSAIVIGLSVAGGFSITGVSNPVLIERSVPLLVQTASTGNYIDFTQHVSENGSLISGTILLLQSSLDCSLTTPKRKVIYSSFNKIQDLTNVKWPESTVIMNSTCLNEKTRFKTKVMFNLTSPDIFPNMCDVAVREGKYVKLGPAKAVFTVDCPYEVLETWCSTHRFTFCIVLLKLGTQYNILRIEYPKQESTNSNHIGTPLLLNFFVNERIESEVLRNTVFLWSTRAIPAAPEVVLLAGLTVTQNASIQEYQYRQETLIDVMFFLSTAVFALLLLFSFGIVSFCSWFKFVYRPGRRKYNKFYSPLEILCSVLIIAGDGNCSSWTEKGSYVIAGDKSVEIVRN